MRRRSISPAGEVARDMSNIIVWDIETIPDLKGFAAANGHDGALVAHRAMTIGRLMLLALPISETDNSVCLYGS
jgi:hypothetical protein